MDVDANDITRLIEKRNERVEQKATRKKEFEKEVEKGEKKLVAERTPSGLYYLQFKGGGTLPEELKGKFTSVSTIRKKIITRYGKDILE
jgi:hypothetical protein